MRMLVGGVRGPWPERWVATRRGRKAISILPVLAVRHLLLVLLVLVWGLRVVLLTLLVLHRRRRRPGPLDVIECIKGLATDGRCRGVGGKCDRRAAHTSDTRRGRHDLLWRAGRGRGLENVHTRLYAIVCVLGVALRRRIALHSE